MSKQVAILGRCGPTEDAKATEEVVRFVSEAQLDELVLLEGDPMDIRLAHGLNSLTNEWHLVLGVLTIDRTRVKPEVFPISRGRLVTD
jgi:hypothetical protein